MRLYISSPHGTSTNLARHLQRVARLYRVGVLDDASTVWINTEVRAPIFWTLSSRPACILWVSAPTSGTVRLTKDRVRWAPTYHATTKAPDVDIALDSLPGDGGKHVTVVVDHGHPTEPVQVIDGAESIAVRDGFHQGTDISVIDLKNYVARSDTSPPSATYAMSLAFVHGTNLLTQGMSRKQAAEFEADIERHGIEVSPEILGTLVDAVATFDTAASFLAQQSVPQPDQLPVTTV
ncbi:hypothetical protein GS896_25290 [Rhodococcus hoagii]|nr:hypothetical protein [Prescottella equi]MBM4654181.1 hypothetical protein [Prescottella equi]MBM4719653.1 hypothetical protein [Prescottella equi]NKR23452.1 hypothetical protein [Prescottella equi]NKT55936.1 hypothetical protein [Prescottella equi]